MCKIFLVFAVFWVSSAVIAQDKELNSGSNKKMSIAVNNFLAQGISESEAATLTDVLRSRLIETNRFNVMERSEMDAILKEQAFQGSGACSDEACIVEMGQVLGIDNIIAGSIGKVGSAYSVNARIISVATGKIVKTVTRTYTGPIEGLLTSEITLVANELAGIENRTSERVKLGRKSNVNKRKRRRNIIIGVSSGAVVVVGVVAIVKFSGKSGNSKGDLEVIW